MSDTADASPVSIPSYCRLLKNPNVLTAKATSDPTCEFGDKFKGLEAVGNRAAAEKDKGQSLGPSHESKYGQAGSNPPHSAFSQYMLTCCDTIDTCVHEMNALSGTLLSIYTLMVCPC